MKKVFLFAFSLALLLGLAFAQNTGGADTGGAGTGGAEPLGSGVVMGESGGVGRVIGQMTFADFDTDGNGEISQAEFDAAMGMMSGDSGGSMMGNTGGAMMGDSGGSMMSMTFADFDTDGNGEISQAEFDAAMGMMSGDSGGAMMGGDTGGSDSGGN